MGSIKEPKLSEPCTGIVGPMGNMLEPYHKMGLSEKEIAKRIICKCNRVLSRRLNLGECDKKRGVNDGK